jgi:hypothetical protein
VSSLEQQARVFVVLFPVIAPGKDRKKRETEYVPQSINWIQEGIAIYELFHPPHNTTGPTKKIQL